MGRRAVVLAAVAALAVPAAANAAPGWVPGSDEVAPHASVHSPSAVVTQDLRTVVVWVQGLSVQAAIRPRGGTFGDPFEVYPGDNSFVPQFLEAIALPDGDVLVTWSGPDFNYPAYAKLVHPDGTVTDAVSIEAGGFHPTAAVTSAGRIALAYYTFNEVKVMARPVGSATFDPAVRLLLLSSSPPESPNSLDVTIRSSDGEIAAAVGTKGVNNSGSHGLASIVIVRRTQNGTNSTEAIDSQTMTLTVPAGQSESGQYDGQIELLSDGNPVLVYRKSHTATSGTQTREIRGGKRTAAMSGTPSALIDSGNFNNFPGEHGLAVDDAGRPSTWWRNDLGADQGLHIARAGTDGVFGASQRLATGSFGPAVLEAFGNGRTGLLFTQDGKEQASMSEGGAAFGTPVVVATPASVPLAFSKLALAGAGEGSAVAFWQDGLTSDSALNATPFDATAPTLGALQAPDALTAGVSGTFSTSALDDWSTPSIAWLFSDGATQPGASVQHAFGAPGSFTATATATDAVGNSASGARTVTVTPAPTPVVDTTPGDNPAPPESAPPPPPDKTPPAITLALTKQKLRTALKKGYSAVFLDNEVGNGVADLFASGKDAKGAAVRKRVAHGTLSVTKTGKQKLVVKFTRKAKKAFKTRRKVTLALVLVVKDAAGNAARKTARVVLKR